MTCPTCTPVSCIHPRCERFIPQQKPTRDKLTLKARLWVLLLSDETGAGTHVSWCKPECNKYPLCRCQ